MGSTADFMTLKRLPSKWCKIVLLQIFHINEKIHLRLSQITFSEFFGDKLKRAYHVGCLEKAVIRRFRSPYVCIYQRVKDGIDYVRHFFLSIVVIDDNVIERLEEIKMRFYVSADFARDSRYHLVVRTEFFLSEKECLIPDIGLADEAG